MLKTLGYKYIAVGQWWLRVTTKYQRYSVTAKTLDTLIRKQIGKCNRMLFDEVYYYTTIDSFREMANKDELNSWMEWKRDWYDCDNFAISFAAHMTEIWRLNCAGIAIGVTLDRKTKKVTGAHAYNIVLADANGKPTLYVYEPQTDKIVKASKDTDMGHAIYRTVRIIWG